MTAVLERMDGAAAPQMVESGPQRLAVGVRDTGLGWVEVRAHVTAGQVAATLATDSASSHAAITAALPSMRESLAAAQVRVDHLGAEQFAASSERRGEGQGSGGQKHRDTTEATATLTVGREAEQEESLSYISVRV